MQGKLFTPGAVPKLWHRDGVILLAVHAIVVVNEGANLGHATLTTLTDEAPLATLTAVLWSIRRRRGRHSCLLSLLLALRALRS